MNPKELLENYILKHPDYWEFEEERREVERLRNLFEEEKNKNNVLALQSYAQSQLYNY